MSEGRKEGRKEYYEACPLYFLLFAFTVFHTDQPLLLSVVPFLLDGTSGFTTKKNRNICGNMLFSLIKT